MNALLLVTLGLALYRAQRLITTDDWPPAKALRDWTDKRFGEDSGWAIFVHCHWCLGSWIAVGGALLAHVFAFDLLSGQIHNRYAVIATVVGALACVVGYLGEKE